MGCGCQTGKRCACDHNRGMHGYYVPGLGAITPADATNQVFPTAKIRSGAGHNQSIWNSIQLAATQGQMVGAGGEIAYVPGTADCAAAAGVTSGAQNDMKLVSTGAGLALSGVQIGLLATGTALGPVTLGISVAVSAIVGLFSTLVAHHAQAVQKEQSTLCSAVPAANNYLKIISSAVASGQATPQDGIDALNSLLSDFESQVSSIRQGSDPTASGECNAACVMQSELHAIVLVMQSQLQDLIAAESGAPAPTLPAPLPVALPGVSVQMPSQVPAQVVVPARPNTTVPAGGAVVPASTYTPFFAPSTPLNPAPTVAATQTPAASALPSWLPIAAAALVGFFLFEGL
jgi:hypothetical protein